MAKLSKRDAFYEKMYFHEISERERLDDRFRTLLAIVAIVFTMIAYLFNTIVVATNDIPMLFWLLYVITIISFVAAISCYIKAWHSQHYIAFPLLIEIEHYLQQIHADYSKQTDERTAARWTDEAYDDFMRQSFIDHTSFNARANDNKRFWLYYGNSFIISAFAFCTMAFFPVAERLVS